ncbi:transglycosylase SLT domain-containing protein [Aquicoccus sp. G2-2]|uniref:transglycosylase SLT domain-containing protein n=1 Tax=Aquicoccus sp. G2-2 TaxID=3092120 RepID=UPI002ADF091F|nr:transglycosylase SLT domain-containing protein [Aquicoccus sp. G2-2]MEA1114395.1 transglycosylase SLT domain-containing protein [Aquicoccus sp. G2-2]
MTIISVRTGALGGAFLLLSLLVPAGVKARATPETVCDRAAEIAAHRTGVPLPVLQAITRTETGRKTKGHFGPWPWTVNMEGKGVWFDSLDAARAYVFRNFKRGARSFDVGCFQINYKWHHQGFSSIDEMFDPLANALYAAGFLKKLHAELGNWSDAAGAYHSRTPKYANRYKAVFEKHRRRASGPVLPAPETTAQNAPPPVLAQPRTEPRENRFPLLQNAGATRLGSLVPIIGRAQGQRFITATIPRGG